ncbi:MAG TPA: hypothetical protein VLA34_07030, partial [Candidatus Krumholzibacterium sp.]|nr:hypothetical protein [Candidatus Krumholzibacterium sp.]
MTRPKRFGEDALEMVRSTARAAWLFPLLAASILALSLSLMTGCSEVAPFTGEYAENEIPVIELTNGPLEGDSVQYNVHFYWVADDPDGTVEYFEVTLVDGSPIGFSPADTAGTDKWTRTICTDTLISTTADEYDTTVTINSSLYAVYDRVHTFFIRAIDDRGGVSRTIHRSFNAWTIAPHVFITDPANVNPDGSMQTLSPVVRFAWYGKDPVDSPWNYQDVDSIRYMWTPFYSSIVRDLNSNPAQFEHL